MDTPFKISKILQIVVQGHFKVFYVLAKTSKCLCTLYLKKRNLQIFINEKLCMKLLLNDEKTNVDPWSHYDNFWGLKNHCAIDGAVVFVTKSSLFFQIRCGHTVARSGLNTWVPNYNPGVYFLDNLEKFRWRSI